MIVAALVLRSNAFAQTWENQHARTLQLPSGGNDFSNTLTIQAGTLGSSGTFTWPLPSAGVITSNGSGTITIGTIGTAGITAGGNNTFLVTNGSGAVSWLALSIDATLSGNGIASALGISNSYPGQTSIITLGTITTGTWHGSTIEIARGGTNSTASPTAGAVAYGDGAGYAFNSAGSSGQVLTSGGTGAPTFTSSLSGLTIDNSSIGATTRSTGAFTTLSSNGASTLGTGANLTNTFGVGSAATNTIGNASGSNTINGATTFGSTVDFGNNLTSGSNFNITGGSITNTTISNIAGSFTTATASPAITATATGVNATNTAISVSSTNGTSANHAIDVTAGDVRVAGNIYTTGGGTILADGVLTANNGLTLAGGTAAFGVNQVTGSYFTITGANGSTIAGTPISGSTGSFTTLTSSSASSIGTGASLTNNFGTGSGSTNNIGVVGGSPAANNIRGNTTFSGSVDFGSITVGGSGFAITGGTMSGVTITNSSIGSSSPSTGAFTTLSSTGNTTLGTNSGATVNSFGTGANAAAVANTIGSTFGGSTNQINGATTFGGAVTIASGSIDNVTIGGTTPAAGTFTSLTLANSASRTIQIAQEAASTTGDQLTLASGAGGAGTNISGGALVLSSGAATGNGSSSITFQAVASGQGSGVTTRNPVTVATLDGSAVFALGGNSRTGTVKISDGQATAKYASLIAATLGADRTYTLPDAGGAASFIMSTSGSGQTIAGGATINGGLTLGTQLSVANGGTGQVSLTNHGILVGAGTSAITQLGVGASNTVLHGNSGADPSFSAVGLTTDVTGTLPVGNGGTGTISLTAHGVVLGNSTNAVNVTSAGTAGQVLTSNGASADPTFQTAPLAVITGYLTVATGTSNATFYYNPSGGSSGTNTTEGLTTTFTSTMKVAHACTARNFYIIQSAAPGTGNTNDWYVRNKTTGTDGPHVQLADAAVSGSDLVTTLTINVGDEIEIKRVSASNPVTTGAQWGFELDYP